MADKNSKSYSPSKGGQDQGGFKRFMYNPDTGEVLGRTGASWFKITVFYIIFFAGLAAFFGLMLWIFLQTLEESRPKWIGDQGLIGSNPGVGFRPRPDQDSNVESTLIWYKRGEGNDGSFWSKQLEDFIKDYENPSGTSKNSRPCDKDHPADAEKWCNIVLQGGNNTCNKENQFGYLKGEPCILIKLNKIFDWKPDPYLSSDESNFPSTMPKDVQAQVKASDADPKVWFSCDGENPADKENLGRVQYFPSQGIPTYYFPYKKQSGYLAPFIFVQLTNPLHGVLINVECKAWAKNIHPSRLERVGTVHFEIMID